MPDSDIIRIGEPSRLANFQIGRVIWSLFRWSWIKFSDTICHSHFYSTETGFQFQPLNNDFFLLSYFLCRCLHRMFFVKEYFTSINYYFHRKGRHNELPSPLSVSADLFHDFSDMQMALTFKDVGMLALLRNPRRPQNDANPGWILIFYVVLFLFFFLPDIIYYLADDEIPTLARNKKELLFIFL